MKKVFALLLAILICLSGCARPEPISTTAPVEEAILPTETTFPTEITEPAESTEAPEETIPLEEPADDALVRVIDYIPGIRQSLMYATVENFTGQVIYDFTDAYLRYGTIKKLKNVCEELAEQDLGLLIWDGMRPVAAQFKLWEVCPDPTYVANPITGYSSHSRGNTVDLTLVDASGTPLEMPTGFDDFSALADRNYSDCGETAAANAQLLQDIMEKHGFSGYFGEWWHFSDTQSYPVAEDFALQQVFWYYADCNEFISLREEPNTAAKVITKIPANEEFQVLALEGNFALAHYQDMTGYVHQDYIQPVSNVTEPAVWIANCEEFISLRKTPGGEEVLANIPDGSSFTLLDWRGKYARVSYNGLEGYVLTSHIMPENADYFASCLDTVVPTDTYSYDQMLLDIAALEAAYPDTVSTEVIGTSELGREIPVIRLGSPDAKYHVLLQGAIHAREHMTAWLLMAMADYWLAQDLSGCGDVCYHIIPMSNPDGVAISQSGTLEESQEAIYQSDKDLGYAAEASSDYAVLWKANGLGIDLNRNFPSGWDVLDDREGPSSQQYQGSAPFSAAEAAVLRDYTLRYPFDATISYHASGSLIYYEYGDKQPVNDESLSLAQAVGALTGYELEGSKGVSGAGYKDWAIDELLIPSLTIEIGCEDAPLAQREIYSIFARNCGLLPTLADWLQNENQAHRLT